MPTPTRRRRLTDAYSFPGFRPQLTVRGVFGDPKMRVVTLTRQSKNPPVAPAARVDDGLLDLVTIEEVGLLKALFKIVKLYRGTLLGEAVVRHLRSATLRIDADPPAEVEAEGQIVGRTPAVFSVLPGALEVVVPREAG